MPSKKRITLAPGEQQPHNSVCSVTSVCRMVAVFRRGRQDAVGSPDPLSSSFSPFLYLQLNSQSGHESNRLTSEQAAHELEALSGRDLGYN